MSKDMSFLEKLFNKIFGFRADENNVKTSEAVESPKEEDGNFRKSGGVVLVGGLGGTSEVDEEKNIAKAREEAREDWLNNKKVFGSQGTDSETEEEHNRLETLRNVGAAATKTGGAAR